MRKNQLKLFLMPALIMLFSISVFAESGYAYDEKVLETFSPKWEIIQSDDTVIFSIFRTLFSMI